MTDGEGEGAGSDALGALGDGLAGEFESFSGQVFEGGGEEDGGAGGDALGEATLAEHATNAADGEGEAGLLVGGALLDGLLGNGLLRSSHVWMFFFTENFFERVVERTLVLINFQKLMEKSFKIRFATSFCSSIDISKISVLDAFFFLDA